MNETRIYRGVAFANYIKELLIATKEDNETIQEDIKYDFIFPRGLKILGIKEESYGEVKYFSLEKDIEGKIGYIEKLLISNVHLYLFLNIRSGSRYLRALEKFQNRIITLDQLENLDVNRLLEYKNKVFKKINKCIHISMLDQLILYYARSVILKAYFSENEVFEYEDFANKNWPLLPFIYKNFYFYNKKTDLEEVNLDNKVLIRVTDINVKGDFLEIFLNREYHVLRKDASDFSDVVKTFMKTNIQTYNVSEKVFYKYKPILDKHSSDLLNEFTKKIIEKDEVFFAPKSLLNDPFDLDIRSVIAKYDPYLDKYEVERYKVNDNPCIVLSLTTEPTNLLMWSHYADSHKGICLRYKINEIIDQIDTDSSVEYGVIGNVDYEYERVKFRNIRSAGKLLPFAICEQYFHLKSVFTKYKKWEYEDEYRVVLFMKDKELNAHGHIFNVPYKCIYYTESIDASNERYLLGTSHVTCNKLIRDDKKYLLK